MVNDYFEVLVASGIDQGGEVLSFIGDATLTIFHTGEDDYVFEKLNCALLQRHSYQFHLPRIQVNIWRSLNQHKLSDELQFNIRIFTDLFNAQYLSVTTP